MTELLTPAFDLHEPQRVLYICPAVLLLSGLGLLLMNLQLKGPMIALME